MNMRLLIVLVKDIAKWARPNKPHKSPNLAKRATSHCLDPKIIVSRYGGRGQQFGLMAMMYF
jgi:hypothetical protein